jgi:CelD/BcsL family acetyltransferase involved in cellulose biosynthesis
MLAEAGRVLLDGERFRLFTVRTGDEVAAAELFVVAGGVVAAWGGGFDERWQSLSPSIVAVAAAVEDACARGERCLDLGEGAEPYKLRFGEAVEPVVWTRLYPHTRRYPITRVKAVPHELRHAVRRRLSPAQRARLKRLVARVRPRA